MVHPLPEIAIVEPNTLTALGLQTLLEDLLPGAEIRTFATFEQLTDDTPDMYAHYFVSAAVYFEHTGFFLSRGHKAILLATGAQAALSGVPWLDVALPRPELAASILRLRDRGHAATHPCHTPELTPREVEVLALLTRGFINKEIAEKLGIAPTTVISHRKHISEKLGIKSVPGLAVYAVMHGYVEADRL